MGIGIPHLIIILAIVLLVVGPGRLEGVGSGLGKAIRGFKKGLEGDDEKVVEKDASSSDKDKDKK